MSSKIYKKITTTIPADLWEIATNKHWKWAELVIFAIVNKEKLPTEVEELRRGNTRIQLKLTEFSTRIWKLEERVQDLEREVEILKKAQ